MTDTNGHCEEHQRRSSLYPLSSQIASLEKIFIDQKPHLVYKVQITTTRDYPSHRFGVSRGIHRPSEGAENPS
ncbi:MAG TPA: hypothetical protein G4O07_00795 [Dehalococcoidia bacterium]|nr:hypothetical protein [Dehalococcoidia bacterium]